MKFELTSFGRKYGLPEADMLFDVRCLDNPYWVPELRSLSGLDEPVRDYIFQNEESTAFAETLLRRLLRSTEETLRVAVGCTGGRHRSVAVTEYLARGLRAAGHAVSVTHRDIARG